jgi:hypothetical protein
MAEGDVSIYTRSQKEGSREGGRKEEGGKGGKREGTHSYPARKRQLRRCCDAKRKTE